MKTTVANFWALCDAGGSVEVAEDGHACVFGTRKEARAFLESYNPWDKLHVEKVEIR